MFKKKKQVKVKEDLMEKLPISLTTLSKANIIRKQQFCGMQEGEREFISFMHQPLTECGILKAF